MARCVPVLILFTCIASTIFAQNNNSNKNFAVIGYYSGRTAMIDSFDIEKLTHLIFSFCHLKGNFLSVNNARDTATILRMVALKKRNPQLKVILSLGGWGGCQYCSEVFSTRRGRKIFSRSAKKLCQYFGTDGIDLDWEYPVIPGFPGHTYDPSDKPHFTALVKQLRKKLGEKKEISFAAGGFTSYLDSAIEWTKVMARVDRVNLMSYDLVNGFSTLSGHHTPLYSTPQQVESVDNGVKKLIAAGVPPGKIAIGAAFYARLFEVTDTSNAGLYRPGKFYHGLPYRRFEDSLSITNGFTRYWDTVAKAPYAFNNERKILATYDDTTSMKLKTRYVVKNRLNGVMFWQLAEDTFSEGLLEVIDEVRKEDTTQ
ncbi:MAG: glycoside hydrolase family 18 protein [Ginsengibacter sp.]